MADFARRAREALEAKGVSMRAAARALKYDPSHVSRILNGRQQPSAKFVEAFDDFVGAGGALRSAYGGGSGVAPPLSDGIESDEESAAWDLSRVLTASDVGDSTLERLEMAVDELAIGYPGTPPAVLLGRVRRHLDYASSLTGRRMTLDEHRRLLDICGWLSLLAATCAIDLQYWSASEARLNASAKISQITNDAELSGWCLETQAWQSLTDGDYRRAITLSQGAQQLAPRTGSAFIQASAQEGRAWARIGDSQETYRVLQQVEKLVEPLPAPERPEHHFRYDPAKAEAYIATTLSWLGDPAAERYARIVLERLESNENGPPRPRRAASARIDLSLALISRGKEDEAGLFAFEAVTSGRLVPSNYWRVQEVIRAIEARNPKGALPLREAYQELCVDDGQQVQ
ncbi:helix-turn-helix domain-containing protein [Streptomonospora alba]|uniref:helix-turn-helix domain-containing protein n=1 Tax=Streptomonospora alba TaxID=183763 RepID=UPI0009FE76E0|nr:helix-turn-helix transcriptional regulator [Streptomonospora alba]